jgi:hypothetical protein
MTVTPDDLATYLDVTSINEDRAQLLIDKATAMCQSIVSPLIDADDAVVLDVAQRAYTNPTNAQSQSMPAGAVAYAPVGGGLWLTRQNIAILRRNHGGGGAYTIDVTPAGAAQNLPWWDANAAGLGDWDVPA